jgi:hypothetical protein
MAVAMFTCVTWKQMTIGLIFKNRPDFEKKIPIEWERRGAGPIKTPSTRCAPDPR